MPKLSLQRPHTEVTQLASIVCFGVECPTNPVADTERRKRQSSIPLVRLCLICFMPTQTIVGGGIMFSGRPSVRPVSVRCPLTPISREATSLYSMEGFE